jgi:predicted CopG family antitoxin
MPRQELDSRPIAVKTAVYERLLKFKLDGNFFSFSESLEHLLNAYEKLIARYSVNGNEIDKTETPDGQSS